MADDKAKKQNKTPEAGMPAAQEAEAPGSAFKMPALGIVGIIAAVVFLPTTILFCIGMMPTLASFVVDRSRKKSKTITVGAMNIAGCMPFLLKLWLQDHSLQTAWEIVGDPKTIIVMYSIASVGYLLDWSLTGIISTVLYQRGMARRDEIERRQIDLIEKWGKKVTGEIPLDNRGFPLIEEPEDNALVTKSKD